MKSGHEYSKQEFKEKWESDDNGGGITVADVAACAIAWGVCSNPRTRPMSRVLDLVVQAAGCEPGCDRSEYEKQN